MIEAMRTVVRNRNLVRLFTGEFMHRDSLGSAQLIRPGDVNWMVAGRGIVHSERTPPEARPKAARGFAPLAFRGATAVGVEHFV